MIFGRAHGERGRRHQEGSAEFMRRLAESGNGNYTGSGGSFTATMLFALAGL